MRSLLNVYTELASLAAMVGLALTTLLVLRNPNNPDWLRSDFASRTISVALAAVVTAVLAWAIHAMTSADLSLADAGLITAATVAVSGLLLWFGFGIGARLSNASAGRSPFARGYDAPAPFSDGQPGHDRLADHAASRPELG